MPKFDWTEFARLADDLRSGTIDLKSLNTNYAAKRTAISRYYYSMFKRFQDELRDAGWGDQHPQKRDHYKIPEYFLDTKGRRDIFNKLNRLKSYRHMADYNTASNNIDDLLKHAKKNYESLNSLCFDGSLKAELKP